jgi:hypothetical protein
MSSQIPTILTGQAVGRPSSAGWVGFTTSSKTTNSSHHCLVAR